MGSQKQYLFLYGMVDIQSSKKSTLDVSKFIALLLVLWQGPVNFTGNQTKITQIYLLSFKPVFYTEMKSCTELGVMPGRSPH